jgi:sterol desaturase/sphingolipid hydroxylase (fatty acid hydroxylase superfamily)
MVSLKSIKTFFYVNGFLFGLSVFIHWFHYFPAWIRNIAIVVFIDHGTKNKKDIHPQPKSNLSYPDSLYFISTTVLQEFTESMIFVKSNSFPFLIKLFLFEIVMDLMHYTFHRLLHTYGYWIHKDHHHYQHPQLVNTFYHHPLDLIILHCIPLIVSFYIFPFSPFQTKLVLSYISFIEISGHSGKRLAPSCSFPLCIWIPKILGIELYTEDHDLHHATSNCNYAKRFALWDILFSTLKRK